MSPIDKLLFMNCSPFRLTRLSPVHRYDHDGTTNFSQELCKLNTRSSENKGDDWIFITNLIIGQKREKNAFTLFNKAQVTSVYDSLYNASSIFRWIQTQQVIAYSRTIETNLYAPRLFTRNLSNPQAQDCQRNPPHQCWS